MQDSIRTSIDLPTLHRPRVTVATVKSARSWTENAVLFAGVVLLWAVVMVMAVQAAV